MILCLGIGYAYGRRTSLLHPPILMQWYTNFATATLVLSAASEFSPALAFIFPHLSSRSLRRLVALPCSSIGVCRLFYQPALSGSGRCPGCIETESVITRPTLDGIGPLATASGLTSSGVTYFITHRCFIYLIHHR